MLVSVLVRLCDYGYWANKRVLNAVSELTPKQFTQSVAGSHGSVRNKPGDFDLLFFVTGPRGVPS